LLTKKAVLTLKEVVAVVKKAKRRGQRIVTTNGCFDLLHYGHVCYLTEAKALGDLLIVGINSDASVRRLKGANRPLNSAQCRAALVAALKPVDYAFVFSSRTPVPFIKAIQPDIHVKGGDYSGRLVEQETVERYGGRVKLLSLVPGLSTTALIKRMGK